MLVSSESDCIAAAAEAFTYLLHLVNYRLNALRDRYIINKMRSSAQGTVKMVSI